MAAFDIKLPESVCSLIGDGARSDGLDRLLAAVLNGAAVIGYNLRSTGFSVESAGTSNAFGDVQLDADMKADAVLLSCLRETNVVETASSEENPVVIPCGGRGFSVAFDPLDGSSIIDTNFAVGTIIGIWPGSTLMNRTGREMAASLIVQYGPRLTAAVAINAAFSSSGAPIAFELTLHTEEWVLSTTKLEIQAQGKVFAPGNLRATADNAHYKALIDYWIDNKYTLRYSGGLVPDVYHILLKGKGVLSNASSKSARAKLRLLYECAPIALIVEAAGGSSCVCASEVGESMEPVSLLDVVVKDLDQRVGVCYGSTEEVERFKNFMYPVEEKHST